MAVVCDDRRLLFILTPRTASTAIGERIMIEQWGGCYLPAETLRDDEGNVVPKKHTTVLQLLSNGLLRPDQRSRLTVFTTVRNPFESLASLYLKQRHRYQHLLQDPASWVNRSASYRTAMNEAREHSFPDWLRLRLHPGSRHRPVFRRLARQPQPREFQGRMREGVDVVLRYEHLQDDFDRMLSGLGISPTPIPRFNPTDTKAGTDWRTLYDAPSVRLVERVYAPTLERFGYRWGAS